MNISNNAILITGGTSGIGFELATQLLALGNAVIITGRDQAKLDRIKKEQPLLHTIQSDVTDPRALASLYQRGRREYPALNILINHAGVMRKINLQDKDKDSDLEDISKEIETNLVGPVRMVKQFLPQLKAQLSAAIVNVSSGLAFTPFPISPIHGATKAGLHSFTQSLRVQLKNTSVKVFGLALPSTQTPLQNGFDSSDTKGSPMMDVKKLVRQAIRGFQKDHLAILSGLSKALRFVSRIAPGLAVKAASGPVDAMLAQTKL
jgi:uncharacterized oxidoreductase